MVRNGGDTAKNNLAAGDLHNLMCEVIIYLIYLELFLA